VLRAGFAMSGLVTTVMMATLVVGPFYLARALGLGTARVGIIMSVGPLVVALTAVPAGRLVDTLGAGRLTLLGLIATAAGSVLLSLMPAALGVPGYLMPIVVVTLGYAVFQTANNTAIMKDVRQDQRGVISGMLNLSRNLGLITGASVMGAVFALAAGTSDMAAAHPEDVATGMRATFAVAAMLIVIALVFAMKSHTGAARAEGMRRRAGHPDPGDDDSRSGAQDGEDASTLPVGIRSEAG
jgi:MFS family permease